MNKSEKRAAEKAVLMLRNRYSHPEETLMAFVIALAPEVADAYFRAISEPTPVPSAFRKVV